MPSGLWQGGGKSESGDSRHSLTIWSSFPSASSFWRSSDPPIRHSLKKTKGGFVLPGMCVHREMMEQEQRGCGVRVHWRCLTLRSDHCSNLAQVSDFVKTNFLVIFHDFLVIYANSAISAKVSPVSEPSFERHGACHVSQSSSMDINEISDFVKAWFLEFCCVIISVISTTSADGIWDFCTFTTNEYEYKVFAC